MVVPLATNGEFFYLLVLVEVHDFFFDDFCLELSQEVQDWLRVCGA